MNGQSISIFLVIVFPHAPKEYCCFPFHTQLDFPLPKHQEYQTEDPHCFCHIRFPNQVPMPICFSSYWAPSTCFRVDSICSKKPLEFFWGDPHLCILLLSTDFPQWCCRRKPIFLMHLAPVSILSDPTKSSGTTAQWSWSFSAHHPSNAAKLYIKKGTSNDSFSFVTIRSQVQNYCTTIKNCPASQIGMFFKLDHSKCTSIVAWIHGRGLGEQAVPTMRVSGLTSIWSLLKNWAIW